MSGYNLTSYGDLSLDQTTQHIIKQASAYY